MNMPLEHDFAAMDAWAARHGTPAFPDMEEATPAAPRFPILSADDLMALEQPPELIRGVLVAEGLASIFGPSASGKSFLVQVIEDCVARGTDFFGHRVVRPVPVMHLALEGSGGLPKRLLAHRQVHGPLPENLRFCTAPLSLQSPLDREELIQAAREAGHTHGLLVIDTLAQASGGCDENSSEGMGTLLAGLQEIQRELGGCVLVCHHTGKDTSKGARGHSSFFAALDSAIEVTRAGDLRSWSIAKSKDGQDGLAHPFRLRVVEVGHDDDGQPITSCVVEQLPEDDKAPMTRRPAKPTGGNLLIVFNRLGELLRKAGDRRPDGAPESLPKGRPVLAIEDAVEQIKESLPVEPRRRGERCRDALARLVAAGHFVTADGWIWAS